MRYLTLLIALILFGCSAQQQLYNGRPPVFQPIVVDYQRNWDHITHPFTGAAVIDVDGDGRDEVFVGGAQNQADGLFRYQNGKLVNIIEGSGLSSKPKTATYGVTALDMDHDGRTDLIICRDDGVYLYLNRAKKFEEHRIQTNTPKNASPFHVALADIDHDGDVDLYISMFVNFAHFRSATFNDADHAKPNRLLLNNGDLSFTDITQSSGTAGTANTFDASFVDLNNDGWQDLVVANNTGPIEIFKNNHDRTFTRLTLNEPFGFWMGVGIGDIDNDGDQDLFFPNVGKSIPLFLTKGDLHANQTHTHDWLLLRNEGNFRFSNITKDYGLDNEGFGWGGVFEDFNLDGKLDLSVAQNYIKWPIHRWFKLSGRTFLQTQAQQGPVFQHTPQLGLESKTYSQSSLSVDLNGDGRQDYLWINMQGPLKAYLNTASNNYLTIRLPTNVDYLGAKIWLETENGQSYTREVIAGQGFMTSQTSDMSFGLGALQTIKRAIIVRANGTRSVLEHPAINQTVRIQ